MRWATSCARAPRRLPRRCRWCPVGRWNPRGQARELAGQIGVPLLIKAVGGGGGRGMKRVDRLEDLAAAMDTAAAEAGAAFGDARVYLERYRRRGRHVEVQVLGDGAGEVVHLGERDCSVQRRYQKLIEETPAPALSAHAAHALHDAALRFARRLNYRGAGTVEFLVDAQREEFYFLEMNARIQVEHPVTEMVTGRGPGRGADRDRRRARHCRLVAPAGMSPAPERLGHRVPHQRRGSGAATSCPARARSGKRAGRRARACASTRTSPAAAACRRSTIRCWARSSRTDRDRAAALAGLRAALAATRIEGVTTNLAFQRAVLDDPEFQHAAASTPASCRLLDGRPELAGLAMADIQLVETSLARRQPDACGAPRASTPR